MNMKFNNVTYELPRKTMKINKLIEEVNDSLTSESAYENMMLLVTEGLGKEKVEELLGSSDIEEVDLTELNKLCNQITMKYDEIVMDDQIGYLDKLMKKNGMQSTVDAIRAISESGVRKK